MVELDFHAIKNELALFWRSVLPKKLNLKWREFVKTHWVNFLLETN
jgi:hypothetical protein